VPALGRRGRGRADPERALEVHDPAMLGQSGLDETDRLETVCRPCHATLHPDDPAYGDLAASAPLFPSADAPPAVSTMRTDHQHVCERCQRKVDSAVDLAAYVPEEQPHVLCRPCAGALLAAGYGPDEFEVVGDLDAAALEERAGEAPVRPALLATGAVRVLRPPETDFERFVYDTPLRYVVNPFGFTMLCVVLGVALSFWLF